MWGPLCRSDELWRWLVGRSAHDQILLAVAPQEDHSKTEKVVGYAVIRDSRILEMMTIPEHTAARSLLLARACRDAIDRDHHFVELHTPTTDPCHELLVTAGGTWVGANNGQGDGQWMMKLFDPARWVERLNPLLHERTRAGSIPRPMAISFQVDGEGMRLLLTRRSSRLERDAQVTSPDVQCDSITFQDLLTGNGSFGDTVESGRLRVDRAEVLELLATIFPPKQLWQSPFELLRL